MPGVLTMHVAGLKALVLAHGGTLFLAQIMVASLADATLIVLASTTSIIRTYAAQPIGLAMVCKMAKLAHVVLLEFVVHLTLHVDSNLVELRRETVFSLNQALLIALKYSTSVWSILLQSLQPEQTYSALPLMWKVISPPHKCQKWI